MSNTSKNIPQKVKTELIERIKEVDNPWTRGILEDVFIHEMSCVEVSHSGKYLSNRNKVVSIRRVQQIVNEFYPDYYNIRRKAKKNQRYDLIDVKYSLIDKRGCRCEKCGRRGVRLELDHIIPIADGGTNEESNLQLLCRPCHLKKTHQEMEYRRKIEE